MTMRFSLRLPQRQARMVALATAYHLARPQGWQGCRGCSRAAPT